MKATMAWRRSERLIVVVHGEQSPSNLEWQRFLTDCLLAGLGATLRVLVVSHGGRPDTGQREQLVRAMGKTPSLTVVMTKNAIVRAAASALRFFNPHMIALGLDDMEGAVRHLELSVRESEAAVSMRRALEQELSLPSRW
jgi:hypothetical protein